MQRDLSCEALWAQSLARSRARREAAAAAAGVKLPARSLSVAALVAVSGATVAGVTALQAGSADQAVAAVVKSRGGDVRELQQKLGVGADGVFGPVTERALKRWQRAHGLVADGIAGPNTRAAMGLGPGPVLKRKSGARGAPRTARAATTHRAGGVRALQRRDRRPRGRRLRPCHRVRAQALAGSHGLVADGVAGPNTRAKMGLGAGPMLKRGGSRAGGGGSGSSTLKAVIRAANQIASHPYKYGGGHGSFQRLGLRLLGVGLVCPPRRRAAALAARLGRLHALRRPRSRALHHDLREPGPRLHGRERPPLRHERALRDGRLALDKHDALVERLRRPAPARPLRARCRSRARRSARPRRGPRAASAPSAGRASSTGSPRPRARRPSTSACGPARRRSW